ncbi:MAG: NADH dehydrogenase-like protein [Anaerolineae bacterium]|nr:NADH dehydrogenase-like protein [Anaerolineae bacterium]
MQTQKQHHVVIIGGGFGGLYTAKAFKNAPAKITIIDRRNFHLFQPLLYQVATGGLSPGDIAYPIRAVFSANKNVTVLNAEVLDIDPQAKEILLRDGKIQFDTLVVATGVSHHYFGNDEWAADAPGLKTIENALDIRSRILRAFEAAERESDPEIRRAWMNFVVVGGGPTGVELAGALGELANKTLKGDFRNIDPTEVNILLLEGANRVLPPYPPELSAKAQHALERLGVTVRPDALVTDVRPDAVVVKQGERTEQIATRTVLWAAGMQASPLGQVLANRAGVKLDRAGRVMVEPDLSLAGQPNIFVIGDLAHFAHQTGQPLPGVAPVAMQQGRYVAGLIKARLTGQPTTKPFEYFDKGSLAVIGRNAAVAQIGRLKINGYLAWLAWTFIHIWYLVGFDNKLLVMLQWAWNYITWNRGARLITEQVILPAQLNKTESEPVSQKLPLAK